MTTSRQIAAEATKQKIIESAYRIVGEFGFDCLTSARLVKEAGIAKGTLYHHFDSLDDVTCAMLCQISEGFMVSVPIENFDDIRSYFYAIGDYLVDVIAQNQAIMNVFLGMLPKGLNNDQFNQICIELMEKTCQQIMPAVKQFYQHKITEQQVDDAVRMVDIFSIGFCVHQGMFDDKEHYRRLWRDFSDMLVAYIER